MIYSRSVFIDEGVLDLNYVPPSLIHREKELRFLSEAFRFIIAAPYEMSQRVIVVGNVGSGKTALAQRFGLNLMDDAKKRRIRARYIHLNCRELRGSLFLILKRAMRMLKPGFPDRGYSSNELLGFLIQTLDELDDQLVLCLDEVEALVEAEGANAIYYLTRVQEERIEEPRRLSLLLISKGLEAFRGLDKSTLSTLQRNVISLPEYTKPQLADIIRSRAESAFKSGSISEEAIDFVSELAAAEGGDARYAIDLLWRAGKYADVNYSDRVSPEHIRQAAATLFPSLREESVRQLSHHERLLLLAVARHFKHAKEMYASTGEVEQGYHVVCEEYGVPPRKHTQFWKYLNNLKSLDIVSIKLVTSPQGKTHIISLAKIPAEVLEKEVEHIIGQSKAESS